MRQALASYAGTLLNQRTIYEQAETLLAFGGTFSYIAFMNACFRADDLTEHSQQALQGFDQRVALLPKDMCAPFHEEARNLETELLSLYRVVVLSTKREEDISEVSKWWEHMVSVCDEFAKRLGALRESHPHCGAQYYYDRVFDLRNKCQRLQKMHA